MSDFNFSTPDEDYDPNKKSEFNFSKADELASGSFELPYHVKGMGKGEAALIGVGRGMSRAKDGLTDLAYATGELFGSDKAKRARAKLKQKLEEEQKLWDQGIANELSPVKNWARGGEIGGQVVSGLAIPGGGQTMLGRAGIQAAYNGLFEAATTPGSAGDRVAAGGLGAIGAAGGSLGMDALMKPLAGALGKWGDDAAQVADLKATEVGLRPSVGQLKDKVRRNMTAAQLGKQKPNNIGAIEEAVQSTPGARHRTDVQSRQLKEVLGITDDIKTSVAKPKLDADLMADQLRTRSEEIWQPFKKAARGTKQQVFPLELWNGVQELAKHNSKLLGDSSAIPDDIVRGRLQDLLDINNPAKLPKYSAEEYSKIISELSNAQHRLTILSGGQTPTYDAASVARITDVFGKAKNDMAMWGKKNQGAYSAWQKALDDYQTDITPVRANPVFETASKLNPKGRDVTKLAQKVTDPSLSNHVKDLITQYRKYGIDNGADRLDVMDTMRRATNNLGGIPNDGSAHLISSLGAPVDKISSAPWFKKAYFGDAGVQAPTKLEMSITGGKSAADLGLGALGQLRRAAPISLGRESGGDMAVLAALFKDLLGSDSGDGTNEQDPNYSHGIGAATQAGVMGR